MQEITYTQLSGKNMSAQNDIDYCKYSKEPWTIIGAYFHGKHLEQNNFLQSSNSFGVFLEKFRHKNAIMKLTDLYLLFFLFFLRKCFQLRVFLEPPRLLIF